MSNATSFIPVHSAIQLHNSTTRAICFSPLEVVRAFFSVFSDPARERLWNASLPPVKRMPLHLNSNLCPAQLTDPVLL